MLSQHEELCGSAFGGGSDASAIHTRDPCDRCDPRSRRRSGDHRFARHRQRAARHPDRQPLRQQRREVRGHECPRDDPEDQLLHPGGPVLHEPRAGERLRRHDDLQRREHGREPRPVSHPGRQQPGVSGREPDAGERPFGIRHPRRPDESQPPHRSVQVVRQRRGVQPPCWVLRVDRWRSDLARSGPRAGV